MNKVVEKFLMLSKQYHCCCRKLYKYKENLKENWKRYYLKQRIAEKIFYLCKAAVSNLGSGFLAIPDNSFLISAIARPGFKPLGQVRVQFMMV
ncbi:hypothetical protein DOY81_002411 [Sarcophaga bullata]|nr:hypothetical protein DOY81_002411 [Sarcophaga bullata]